MSVFATLLDARDTFLDARDAALAARGCAPRRPRQPRRVRPKMWPGEPPPARPDQPAPGQPAAQSAYVAQLEARNAALETALRDRDEDKRLIADLAACAGQLDDRVAALIAAQHACEVERDECKRLLGEMVDFVTPLAKALRLPGVKAFLLHRFHPDKHAEADAKERAVFTAALKIINDAYAIADKLQVSD